MKEDILYVDKPAGMSSFDVIRRLRVRYKQQGQKPPKIGHAGTLDPLASGLLVIGIGREGTKQLNEFVKLDKTYEVAVELGVRTDTGDREGDVIDRSNLSTSPSATQVRSVLDDMIGTLTLPVPRYSAVKVGGESLYKKARRGETFDPPERDMEVYDLELREIYEKNDTWYLDVVMDVASGVFVRSIVEEIGRRIGLPAAQGTAHAGCPATTAALRRTRIGDATVGEAKKLN